MPGVLDARERDEAIRKLSAGPLDVLVIGGGITGAGRGLPVALTAGFRAGFVISAVLAGVSVLTAATLLREDGRGQSVNLVELQAG